MVNSRQGQFTALYDILLVRTAIMQRQMQPVVIAPKRVLHFVAVMPLLASCDHRKVGYCNVSLHEQLFNDSFLVIILGGKVDYLPGTGSQVVALAGRQTQR